MTPEVLTKAFHDIDQHAFKPAPGRRSAGFVQTLKDEIRELERDLAEKRRLLAASEASEERLDELAHLRLDVKIPNELVRTEAMELLADGVRRIKEGALTRAPTCAECEHVRLQATERPDPFASINKVTLDVGCKHRSCVKTPAAERAPGVLTAFEALKASGALDGTAWHERDAAEKQIRAAASDEKSNVLIGPGEPELPSDVPATDSTEAW